MPQSNNNNNNNNDTEPQNESTNRQQVDTPETQHDPLPTQEPRQQPQEQNDQAHLMDQFNERVEELRSCQAMCLLCFMGPCMLPRLCCLFGPNAVCSCILIFCCGVQFLDDEEQYDPPLDPRYIAQLRNMIQEQITTRRVTEVTSDTENNNAIDLNTVPTLAKLPAETRVPVSNVAVAMSQGIAISHKTVKFSDIVYYHDSNETVTLDESKDSFSQSSKDEKRSQYDDAESKIISTQRTENIDTVEGKNKVPATEYSDSSKGKERQKRNDDSDKINPSLVLDDDTKKSIGIEMDLEEIERSKKLENEDETSELLKSNDSAKKSPITTTKDTKSSPLLQNSEEETENQKGVLEIEDDETAKFLRKTTSEVSTDSIHSWHENYVTCSICLSDYDVGDLVSWSRNPDCNHGFHKECITDWLLKSPNCPCCRLPYIQTPDQNNSE